MSDEYDFHTTLDGLFIYNPEHEEHEGAWPLMVRASDHNESVAKLQTRLDAQQKATRILWDCIQALKELGATVAICGIDPEVMAALPQSENSPAEDALAVFSDQFNTARGITNDG